MVAAPCAGVVVVVVAVVVEEAQSPKRRTVAVMVSQRQAIQGTMRISRRPFAVVAMAMIAMMSFFFFPVPAS